MNYLFPYSEDCKLFGKLFDRFGLNGQCRGKFDLLKVVVNIPCRVECDHRGSFWLELAVKDANCGTNPRTDNTAT